MALHGPVIERKLAALQTFTDDLNHYAELDAAERRRGNSAIERLLQVLCESAADIGLRSPIADSERALATSHREVSGLMRKSVDLPGEMARQLIAACGRGNLLTHLQDAIDLDRVVAAVNPAVALYRDYLSWATKRLG